ncbi:uracil-DNA glycosylase [Paraburkholderia fungorum]|uniref:uracil-DNA glycosylase n=1 Tax=Paraburkholderia fungorum TaxID=134537 RepID=UPI0038B72763
MILKTFTVDWQDTNCAKCPLSVNRLNVVKATLGPVGGLLAVGEAPGAEEDKCGKGFVGKSGDTLRSLLRLHGIQDSTVGLANVCRCRPPQNRPPRQVEVDTCTPFLAHLIAESRPKVVLAVGRTATTAFFGNGSLYKRIQDGAASNDWTSARCIAGKHPAIRAALETVSYVVPMPHTSPLAFRRLAPSGEAWGMIADRQMALVNQLLHA